MGLSTLLRISGVFPVARRGRIGVLTRTLSTALLDTVQSGSAMKFLSMKQRLIDRLNNSNLGCVGMFILFAAILSHWILSVPDIPDDPFLGMTSLALVFGSAFARALDRSGDELQRIVSILNQSAAEKRQSLKGSVVGFLMLVAILASYWLFGYPHLKSPLWLCGLFFWALTSFGDAVEYINKQLSSIGGILAKNQHG